ncbi:MAG: bifunctional diguanylate cyclase/phosphodiesterase, partial [Brevinematales bacterium]|nr:bifunctional diguanylate cyclase/phosphodiesterase [Brevinematales bacterium]
MESPEQKCLSSKLKKPLFMKEYFQVLSILFYIYLVLLLFHFSLIKSLAKEDVLNKIRRSLESYIETNNGISSFEFKNLKFYVKTPDNLSQFTIVPFILKDKVISFYVEKASFERTILLRSMVYVVSFLGTIILFSIMVYILLKKNLFQPIDLIDNALNRAIKGDYSFKLTTEHSNEKVKNIFTRFNYLLDILEIEENEKNTNLYTDTLTKLPNRQKILIDIEQTITPTLIIMNIDLFQEINDCYGNYVGDLTLVAIAERLVEIQKQYYYRLYKMSGDEFAFLFDKKMELEELYSFIKNLCVEIEEQPFKVHEHEIFIKVTVGAARSEDIDSINLKEGKWKSLATHADMALKKAKKEQKHFVIFHESMQISKEFEANLIWKKKLKDAIDTHRVIPFFQPIMNNISGKIEKYETLVRLVDKESGIVSPSYFLDVAKRSHLYGKITAAVLNKSIALFKDTDYEFSINLAIRDIIEEEINNFIVKTIKDNKNIASRIIFEILESEGIENYDKVKDFIKQVKELGCKIAIDDFGSGYSNFDHLMKLDVDYIKLDSCLIDNLADNYNAQIITKTIVNFAKELKLKTISEFVHSEEIFKKSKELGVD